MTTEVRRYVHALGLDAYVVGGAVRDELLGIDHADEDFLVPGVDHAALRRRLQSHGRVEDMEVHGQLVGVRLHPNDRKVARLVPAGIELTPPRAEVSTGPGHRDFSIVGDPGLDVADDMARRDFTINAMARNLGTGALVDPFGGLCDLGRRELRTVSRRSFAEDPLRILRGLRLVSQLGVLPTGPTVVAMRLEADGLRHVSPERIGGGLAADGHGELSKLLLGRWPARALRLARDTGVLHAVLGELDACVGYRIASERQPLPLEEHMFAVVQHTADAGCGLAVRLAALLHDVGKPVADAADAGHAAVGAGLARAAMLRLRYSTRLRRDVVALVGGHAFHLDPWLVDDGGVATRRFLRDHGERLARQLVEHKAADLAVKPVDATELAALRRLRDGLEAQRDSAYRVSDLAVRGDDLIAAGITEGPLIGAALQRLLDAVVEDPRANTRERLLELAVEEGA